jgi:nucleotide-binding universal stress UspA family protein
MGRRQRGIFETLVLGSAANDVLRRTTTDLLLVHAPEDNHINHDQPVGHCPELFSNVMICTDFSEPDIGYICLHELPWIKSATLFHVVTPKSSVDDMRSSIDSAHARLEPMRDEFSRARIPIKIHVSAGSAADDILSFSEREDISLIIMKSQGKRGFLTTLLGSTTAKVARNTGKPVLILKRVMTVKEG